MEGIPEQDMIDHELRIQANNQNGNKKPKSTGSGQYGELSLEQLQQQMAAHKAAISPTTPVSAVAAPAVAYPAPSAPAPLPPPSAPPPIQQAQAYYGYGQGFAYGAPGYNNYYAPPPPPPPPPPQQQPSYPIPASGGVNFGYNAGATG